MIGTYFTYTLLGLSLALPAGAMTVEMMKQGLKNGFFRGWFVGIGGMTIDLTLIILIYLGFSPFLTQPYIKMIMWFIGFFFLLYIGYDSIKNANKDILTNGKGEAVKRSFFNAYMSGLMIAVSPANIVFWLGIFGTALATSLERVHGIGFFLVAAGILSGILIHDLGLLIIVQISRRFMNRIVIKWTSVIAGVILLGFALYFGYEFILGLKDMF
ncbi:LysE family transporter [Sporolactobacillus laevolacticus]|uniref:LysE family transporter n=1 Tax=Sporolactobacillus laevolacticus TaxID=33018 RepID=UPI0025B2F837|nr:LysE family transporter [Sporolactobacillus laevolacticus]MDN3955937.1 LysE family transporter [Sporolactobacillus laevolacticus]